LQWNASEISACLAATTTEVLPASGITGTDTVAAAAPAPAAFAIPQQVSAAMAERLAGVTDRNTKQAVISHLIAALPYFDQYTDNVPNDIGDAGADGDDAADTDTGSPPQSTPRDSSVEYRSADFAPRLYTFLVVLLGPGGYLQDHGVKRRFAVRQRYHLGKFFGSTAGQLVLSGWCFHERSQPLFTRCKDMLLALLRLVSAATGDQE
jgi:hypothetical protein